jgi:polyhydroxyalkanoate synthase subunit PhaE
MDGIKRRQDSEPMTDKPLTDKPATPPIGDWSSLWRSMADTTSLMAEAWSGSVAPFMLTRVSEKAGEVNDLSAAIERMAQGPQLADFWDFNRKLGLAFAAWVDMRSRLANFSAIALVPWSEASRRFAEAQVKTKTSDSDPPAWREAFAKWAEISNEELIKNQRTDGFLNAQKELLHAAVECRSRQNDVSDAISTLFDLPTRRDLDDITRQITELRREVRALRRERRQTRP